MRELKGTDFAYLKARMAHYRNYAAGFGLGGVVLFVVAMATTALLAIVALALWVVAFGSFSRYTHYLKGMRGEMKVGEALRGLDDSWCCFHDVLFQHGAGNIDHIVVGAPGVFALETKNYSGEVGCEGDDWYVKTTGYSRGRRRRSTYKKHIGSPSLQSKRNATLLGGLLEAKGVSAWVHPLVVLTDPRVKLRVRKPTVDIVMVQDLVRYFYQRTPALSEEKMNLLSNVILAGLVREA